MKSKDNYDDSLVIMENVEPHTMTFTAKEFKISSEELCINFGVPVLEFKNIKELCFDVDGEIFRYKKVGLDE